MGEGLSETSSTMDERDVNKLEEAIGDVSAVSGDNENHVLDHSGFTTEEVIPPLESILEDLSSDDQPYDRIISAPPGRIGVTFVSYRGHAMVSNVSDDSPLNGWIFPSDIVIAIDEVPVSGMSVRDIVKLMTAKIKCSRHLRVISSHAMKHLTG